MNEMQTNSFDDGVCDNFMHASNTIEIIYFNLNIWLPALGIKILIYVTVIQSKENLKTKIILMLIVFHRDRRGQFRLIYVSRHEDAKVLGGFLPLRRLNDIPVIPGKISISWKCDF